VILVSVGQHDAIDTIATLAQPPKIRQDDIDAVHIRFGKHQSSVHHDDAFILFNGHAVSADFSQTA
jgi:hypothetical protein